MHTRQYETTTGALPNRNLSIISTKQVSKTKLTRGAIRIGKMNYIKRIKGEDVNLTYICPHDYCIATLDIT